MNPFSTHIRAAFFAACISLFFAGQINAQCKPADDCDNACFMGLAQLNLLNSSTNDFFPGFAPGICATSDNDQWIQVQAKANIGTITVTPSDCVVGNGLQLRFIAHAMASCLPVPQAVAVVPTNRFPCPFLWPL